MSPSVEWVFGSDPSGKRHGAENKLGPCTDRSRPLKINATLKHL